MSNDYYNNSETLINGETAFASDVESKFGAIATAFAKLPGESELIRGKVGFADDGGAVNAYTCTMHKTVTSYVDDMEVVIKIANANTTEACTINVDSQGVKSIKTADGDNPAIGAMTSYVHLRYDADNGYFVLLAAASHESRLKTMETNVEVAKYLSLALNDFRGAWSTLTGPLDEGSGVTHAGNLWVSIRSIPAVEENEPAFGNSDWVALGIGPGLVITPKNTGPTPGAVNIFEQPTLSSGVFRTYAATDTHESSRFRVRAAEGDWETPVYDSGEVMDLVSHMMPSGILLEGENTYYFQVMYKGAELGWSGWSKETSFVTKDVFAFIMGVALTASGGGAGSWQHIDEYGNNITPGTTYFDNHPVWGGMQDATIDSQAMVKVPKFYCKVGTLSSGDQAGKKAWLVSDQPVPGFELHPAFMDGGVAIDQVYIGKYEAADDGSTKVRSASGLTPLAITSFDDFRTKCAARNTGGVDGFHLINVYELAAIQMLALIEMGTPDMQSAISAGNTTGSLQNTGVSADNYRGINQLWSNTLGFIDGLRVTSSGDLQVFDRNGNNTYVTVATGLSGSAIVGWAVSMRENSGTNFDCKHLFLASSVDSTEGNGTFADYQSFYQSSSYDYITLHGGDWTPDTLSGLFSVGLSNTSAATSSSSGARLAKV